MSGTKSGGLKAAATNKAKHGETFYQRIGRLGGQNGHTGGFASNPELARKAGEKGGRISQRGKGSTVKTKVEPIAGKIIEEYINGLSLLAIAKKHNLSYNVLRAWAKDNIQIKAWGEK